MFVLAHDVVMHDCPLLTGSACRYTSLVQTRLIANYASNLVGYLQSYTNLFVNRQVNPKS